MEFVIIETNELRELHYIDHRTGVDCINDLIGNAGAIGDYITYDDDADVYHISKADYEWWEEYITHAQADEEELERLREGLDRRDEEGRSAIDSIIYRYYTPNDMESEHEEWERVFEIVREELGGDDV